MTSGFYPHLFWRASEEDYNCSGKTFEEWRKTGEVSRILGVYFFVVGIVTLVSLQVFLHLGRAIETFTILQTLPGQSNTFLSIFLLQLLRAL
jgi:hypothetical protein